MLTSEFSAIKQFVLKILKNEEAQFKELLTKRFKYISLVICKFVLRKCDA